jgi:4-carboxymuconolactone decarboxylase
MAARIDLNISPTSAPGRIAPRFAEITNEVLFGDIWERQGLSKRDRSLMVVSTLIALNRTEQLGFHLQLALQNGLTRDELAEVITHMAFYSGWPTAISAIAALDKVLAAEAK